MCWFETDHMLTTKLWLRTLLLCHRAYVLFTNWTQICAFFLNGFVDLLRTFSKIASVFLSSFLVKRRWLNHALSSACKQSFFICRQLCIQMYSEGLPFDTGRWHISSKAGPSILLSVQDLQVIYAPFCFRRIDSFSVCETQRETQQPNWVNQLKAEVVVCFCWSERL